ncbi:MAG: adenylate/guanylate cyclase domain-containing protein [Fidelibacterota bacterium]
MAGHIATRAFESVMLSGKGDTADELMRGIDSLNDGVRAQVYDRDGYYVAFGDDREEVPDTILAQAARTFAENVPSAPLVFDSLRHRILVFGLKNNTECQVCHGSDHAVRGMLALWVRKGGKTAKKLPEQVAVLGFKNLMLVQRGMYASQYASTIRRLPFVKTFKVFDNGRKDPEGIRELYVPNPQFSDPVFDDSVEQLIADVNRNGDAILPRMEYREALADGMAYLTQIIPLMNDKKCQACHEPPQKGDPRYERFGDRWKMRSAVKISTSMEPILAEIERNVFASVGVGLFTIFAVAVVLRIFMKIVVVKPLTIIGGTVRQVGEGNLAVSADVSSRDEIGILARQINAMIQGLRERLHLTKFVSSETVEAVKGADLTGVSLGGERRQATVLFSDIRGFTAYSEKVEPEKVIEMLNTFLNEQAQIVRQYRGDIDKFVGDELMAVFQGEKMVEDAVTCAVAIQRKVARLNRNYPQSIGVGIGINAGPMVMGAVGSEDRMDYTVLGDNVNLGARLCGVAGAGQILVSNRAVDLLGKDHSFHLEDREPISVKGKEKPIEVYEVPYTL